MRLDPFLAQSLHQVLLTNPRGTLCLTRAYMGSTGLLRLLSLKQESPKLKKSGNHNKTACPKLKLQGVNEKSRDDRGDKYG